MNRGPAASWLLLLLLVLPGTSPGDAPDSGFWSVQVENDIFGSNDDRYYTSGLEISFTTAETLPSFLHALADAVPFYRPGDMSIHGFSLGQNMFTPEDTASPDLVVDDRPYAGWLYMDMGMAHASEMRGGRQSVDGLVMTLGIVGSASLAEQTQKSFHRLFGVDEPQGWDHQLENEIGLNVGYLRKVRHLFPRDNGRQFEFSSHAGAVLGNVYTYAMAGAMLRWGAQLENDIGPPSIAPAFTGMPAFRPNPAINWYLFAGIEGRLVGRNIFLDGNTFRDSHSVDKETLVGDIQFGFAFHYRNARIAFTNIVRSKEFKGQEERARYGAINLTFYTD